VASPKTDSALIPRITFMAAWCGVLFGTGLIELSMLGLRKISLFGGASFLAVGLLASCILAAGPRGRAYAAAVALLAFASSTLILGVVEAFLGLVPPSHPTIHIPFTTSLLLAITGAAIACATIFLFRSGKRSA